MADEELLNTENEEQENPTPNNSGDGKRKTLISIIVILSILIVVAIILALYFGLRKTDDEQVNPDPEVVEPGPVESDHAWDDGVVLVEPTCTETGLMEYTCTICGATEDVTIPALGHETTGQGSIITEYSDNGVSMGLVEYTCSRCGYEYDQIERLHFGTDTWEEISEYAASGEASSRYYIGETREMIIQEYGTDPRFGTDVNGEDETIILRIVDFDHDDLSETDEGYDNPEYNNGTNKAAMTIETGTLLTITYSINETSWKGGSYDSTGGWAESTLRAQLQPYDEVTNNETYSGELFDSILAEDLQGVIKTVDKYGSKGNKSTEIQMSQDKLFLFSLAEIYSETAINNSTWTSISNDAETYNQEGTQYTYFNSLIGDIDPNSYCGLLAKYKPNPTRDRVPSDTIPGAWFTRTLEVDDECSAFVIGQAGRVAYTSNCDCRGLSFGFCI